MYLTRSYRTGFEAAHIINGHPKCGVKHGHSYKLEVNIMGTAEKFIDFADIKRNVEDCVMDLDHKDLGDVTAEEIAYSISLHLTNVGYKGHIRLWETDKFSVTLEIGNAVWENERSGGLRAFAKYK